jgi:cell wall-associated NlpC family hydrolase
LAKGGTLISNVSDLQPGDIVFFGGTLDSFLHSGIYAGGGQIWDANVSYPVTGVGTRPDGVHEDPLSWQYSFVGAVRMGGVTADGTFVSHDGYVFVMAGGAPLYVSNWAAVGGPQPTVALTDAQWNALSQYPADGTLLCANGYVYEMAGGAPEYVSAWAAIGGSRPCVGIDPADIANADQPVPWNHLHMYPADGTFVLSGSSGTVYEIVGGAPLYVSSWSVFGGTKPTTEIDPADIANVDQPAPWNHLHMYPADGTFINALSSTGQEEGSYVVAGGTPFYISSWSDYGGVQPVVTVDVWDVTNASNSTAHLSATPLDGTIVEGVPSGTYWQFTSGKRQTTSLSSGAVTVEDSSLSNFPIAGTTTISSTSTTTTSTVKPGTTTTVPRSTTTTTVSSPRKISLVVGFIAGRSTLSAAMKSALTQFSRKLLPGASVIFTGYAKDNAALARKRARAASTFLLKLVRIKASFAAVTNLATSKTVVVTIMA